MFKPWMLIGLAGGFGGTAPNIFRVGSQLTSGAPLPEISYVIGVLVFFAMGAGVALSFQEVDAKKAFFLGLSLPAMFQSGVADVSTATQTAFRLTPTVYAAELEEPQRYVKVSINEDAPECSFVFSGENRGRTESLIEKNADGELIVEVPTWATSFTVLVLLERQMSEPYPVFLADEWEVDISEKSLRGFKQAVGIIDPVRWTITVGKKERDTK